MRKSLLASTALVGAVLTGATLLTGSNGLAATPTVADNLKVTIEGEFRVSLLLVGQGAPDPSKGILLRSDEAEIRFGASNLADNGLEYGFNLEVQTQTDDTNNADEAWAFVAGKTFGRIEVGDQDDAPDRMFVAGEDVMKGRGGYDGAVSDIFRVTGILGIDPTPAITVTDDASKIIYFSPRFSGLQLGFSFTPDTGQNGGGNANDGNGSFSDVMGLGANYLRKFGDATVILSAVASLGGNETAGVESTRIWGVGGTLAYKGFEFGAGYVDHGDTGVTRANSALGEDGGQWWDVGLAYGMGSWAVSVGYFNGWAGNQAGTPDSTTSIFSIAGSYNVAPGFDLRADFNLVDVETIGRVAGDDNDGHVFVFSTVLSF